MYWVENIFITLAGYLVSILTGWGLSYWWSNLVLVVGQWGLIIGIITINVLLAIWWERKISGFIQQRLGPNRLGPFGIFQSIADMFKLMTKEDIIPRGADKVLFMLAPGLMVIVAVMVYAVLPWGRNMSVVDLDVGLFFVIAVSSLTTLGLFMAGWGSNNKWSLLGSLRAVAQMVSYEIPLAFSLLGVIMMYGSYCYSLWLFLSILLRLRQN